MLKAYFLTYLLVLYIITSVISCHVIVSEGKRSWHTESVFSILDDIRCCRLAQ